MATATIAAYASSLLELEEEEESLEPEELLPEDALPPEDGSLPVTPPEEELDSDEPLDPEDSLEPLLPELSDPPEVGVVHIDGVQEFRVYIPPASVHSFGDIFSPEHAAIPTGPG
jgi:hypothetical protein